MKYLYILFLFIRSIAFGQTYDLLPDTCTHCSFVYTMGTWVQYEGHYTLLPENDTLYQGNVYMRLPSSLGGVRQVGNKVFSFIPGDTTQEYLIQDWETNVGDTVFQLFSDNIFYDAIVTGDDSLIMNNGLYHHFRNMQGIRFYQNLGDTTLENWEIIWNERGLCGGSYGGLLYNVPITCLCTIYSAAHPHTPDPRYNLAQYVQGCEFTGAFESLEENKLSKLLLYPNPTNDKIDLSNLSNDIFLIRLIDSQGKELLRFENKIPSSLDISTFENGTYLLQTQSEFGRLRTYRIIKSN